MNVLTLDNTSIIKVINSRLTPNQMRLQWRCVVCIYVWLHNTHTVYAVCIIWDSAGTYCRVILVVELYLLYYRFYRLQEWMESARTANGEVFPPRRNGSQMLKYTF
jgi:hypothetical protein